MMPAYLKDLGYNTHMLGKWHLGMCRKECTPGWRGFDTFSGAMAGQGHYFNHTTEEGAYDWFNMEKIDRSAAGTHSQDLIQDGAVKIIRENDGKNPFFMYLAFHNTHSPMEPKEEFLEYYKDIEDISNTRRGYLGLLSGMDYVIGKIVDELKDTGLYDNTIIVFSSDNGGDVKEGDNSPLRGAKGALYEGGVRANMFVHSPLLKKSGYEEDGLIHVSDWLPTFVSLAGGEVPEDDGLNGVDQSDMVINGGPSARDEMIYHVDREVQYGPPQCGEMGIRNERYKLIWGMPGYADGYGMSAKRYYDHPDYIQAVGDHMAADHKRRVKRGGRPHLDEAQTLVADEYVKLVQISPEQFEAGTGAKELYDLKEDPYETNNLADSPDHQDIIDELTRKIQDAVAVKYEGPAKETQIPDLRSLPIFFGGALGVGWCKDSLALPDNLANKCRGPADEGTDCDTNLTRYFFDEDANECREMKACASNGNNFSHLRICESVCMNK